MTWSFEDDAFSDDRRIRDLDGKLFRFAGMSARLVDCLPRRRATPNGFGVMFTNGEGVPVDLPHLAPDATVRDAALVIGAYIVGREAEQWERSQQTAKAIRILQQ